MVTDNVLACLAELKTMDIVALKAMWRDLFATEPPPYKSLSAVARAITGTRWNGLIFFGLKGQRGRGQ